MSALVDDATFCPDRDQTFNALLALLPHGRAHQSHDGAITNSESVLRAFWYAIAKPLQELQADICLAVDEFYCSSANKTLDQWHADYGVPDECEAISESLCDRALAIGFVTTAQYVEFAANVGVVLTARFLAGGDAVFPGVYSTLHVVIDSAASDALSTVIAFGVDAAGWELALVPLGGTSSDPLLCIFAKLLPAHCALTYTII